MDQRCTERRAPIYTFRPRLSCAQSLDTGSLRIWRKLIAGDVIHGTHWLDELVKASSFLFKVFISRVQPCVRRRSTLAWLPYHLPLAALIYYLEEGQRSGRGRRLKSNEHSTWSKFSKPNESTASNEKRLLVGQGVGQGNCD